MDRHHTLLRWGMFSLAVVTLHLPATGREVGKSTELASEADWLIADRRAWIEARRSPVPGSIPLARGAGRRFFEASKNNIKKNLAAEYATVAQRHAFYDVTGYVLHRGEDTPKPLRCIRFFDAAADVTSSFNVGAVELEEIFTDVLNFSPDAKKLLSRINGELFDKNFAILRKLMLDWQEPRDPADFTNKSRLDPMAFDLGMVQFEQRAVEQFLKNNPALVTPAVKQSLANSHPVADAFGLFFSGQGGSVARRKELREQWLPQAGIGNFDFFMPEHRVALGEAYIFFLHGYQPKDFSKYRNTKKIPAASCRGTIP